jgi:hypothetical protein
VVCYVLLYFLASSDPSLPLFSVCCVGVGVDVLSLNAMVKHCLTLPPSPTPLSSAYPHLTQQREEEGKGGGVGGAVWVIEGVIEATHGHTTPNHHTYQVRQRGTEMRINRFMLSCDKELGRAVVFPSSEMIDGLCIYG